MLRGRTLDAGRARAAAARRRHFAVVRAAGRQPPSLGHGCGSDRWPRECAAYADKLTREEFAPGGPFAPLAAWLDIHAPRFGFFRPYQGVRSGVQPEPWHFSFAPIAENGATRA